MLLVTEDPLQLRFENVDVVGNPVPFAELRQCLQVLNGDALGCRAGDGSAEPPVARSVPALDEPGVDLGQLLGRLPGRLVHAPADSFREDVAKKGVFLVLDHIGLIDGHHRTHAAVDVRLHQPVDGLRCRARIVEGVIVNGGHTELQHLDRPQHGAHVIEMRGRRLVAEGRDFVEHEDLERGIVGCALEEVAGRVEVPVDESRHCKQVVGLDDLEVLLLVRNVEVRSDVGDPGVADEDIRPRVFRIVVVDCEDTGISYQD